MIKLIGLICILEVQNQSMGYKYQKEDILKIGYETFQRKGYHEVGVNEILKNANIPKGSFYNFFVSKEDFMLQVLEIYSEDVKKQLSIFLNDKNYSPYNRLLNLYNHFIQQSERNNYSTSCIANRVGIEMGGVSEVLSNTVDKIFLSWIYIIAECVKEAQLLGEIRDDFSALEIAEYLHTGFNGTFSRMKITKSSKFMELWLKMSFDYIKL